MPIPDPPTGRQASRNDNCDTIYPSLGLNFIHCTPEDLKTTREGMLLVLNPIALQPLGALLSQVTK